MILNGLRLATRLEKIQFWREIRWGSQESFRRIIICYMYIAYDRSPYLAQRLICPDFLLTKCVFCEIALYYAFSINSVGTR